MKVKSFPPKIKPNIMIHNLGPFIYNNQVKMFAVQSALQKVSKQNCKTNRCKERKWEESERERDELEKTLHCQGKRVVLLPSFVQQV